MKRMPENAKPHEFFVDSDFQKKARQPGGISREQAIEQAQAHIDALKPDFSDWLAGELQILNEAIRKVAGDPRNRSALDDAYRSCRHLGEAGATMGYELLAFITNNLCRILDAVKDGADYDTDLIGCHVDSLHIACQDPYKNLKPEQLPELSSGLRRIIELANTAAHSTNK